MDIVGLIDTMMLPWILCYWNHGYCWNHGYYWNDGNRWNDAYCWNNGYIVGTMAILLDPWMYCWNHDVVGTIDIFLEAWILLKPWIY